MRGERFDREFFARWGLSGQFPLRPRSDGVGAEARGRVVQLILQDAWEPYIKAGAINIADYYGLSSADADDIASSVMCDLLDGGLDDYDQSRARELHPYLMTCIRNSLRTHARDLRRRRDRHRHRELTNTIACETDAPSPLMQVLLAVAAEPTKFLSPRDARVLIAWLDSDGAKQSELAARLGYKRRQSIGEAMQSIRRRVRELFEQEMDR